MVLGMVGVPGEGIALILGVDRILDMCRTVPNVTGDVLASLWVTKSEGLELRPTQPAPQP
jgi:DAACS family dicarboxylate/amino acid:cation (Na+ or H+) symporter